MNRIDLGHGYFIEIDGETNHTLKQTYIAERKDGSKVPAERVCGYFGRSLDGAIEKYLKLNQIDCMADTAVNMKGYVKMVKLINDEAVRAVQSVLEGRGRNAENE